MKKKLSNEKKDQILKGAQSKLEKYNAEGEGINKYSVNLKYWLEEQDGVAKATIRGRNTITVEFEDETIVGILLDRMENYGGGFKQQNYNSFELAKPQGMFPWMPNWELFKTPNVPGTKKALLFDPLYDDWPPIATTDSIENSLQGAGYSVEKMLGNDGDLSHLETIESNRYGTIFIRSHGGVLHVNGDDKIHIMVRPYFDSIPNVASSGYNGIGVFSVYTNWGWKYAYAFNEEFIRHHLASTRFPNTLMHLLVCHGGDPAGEDDLIDAFLDFGVGCFTGWTRNASLAHGDPAAIEFYSYLCSGFGRTILGAISRIQSLGHSPDPTTGADLVSYGSGTCALVGLPKIEIQLDKEQLEILKKFPKEFIELVVDVSEFKEPWSPWGGKISPIDRNGNRRFIPFEDVTRIFEIQNEFDDRL